MKRYRHKGVPSATSRSGATMVLALLALLVGSLMIAGLLKTVSMSHRQMRRDEMRMQANLLADSGLARAMTLIRARPDFTEEVWNVPVEQLPAGRTAVVRLTIATDPLNPTGRIVSVVAEYPVGHPDQVRITRKRAIP